jgi:hypothetical protein
MPPKKKVGPFPAHLHLTSLLASKSRCRYNVVMKRYEHMTDILKIILLSYQKGYTCWVSFDTRPEKLPELATKFRDEYGTHFSPAERHRRKRKGLPNAVAFIGPDYGRPDLVRVFLMATEHAKTFALGPFSREKWNVMPPEYSLSHATRATRTRGLRLDLAYTKQGVWGTGTIPYHLGQGGKSR